MTRRPGGYRGNQLAEFAAASELTALLHKLHAVEIEIQGTVRRYLDAGARAHEMAAVLGVSRASLWRIAEGEHVDKVGRRLHAARQTGER